MPPATAATARPAVAPAASPGPAGAADRARGRGGGRAGGSRRPHPRPPPAAPTYRSRLGSVRGLFSGAVSALRSGRIDAATWESLEEALIRADVGVATTNALLDDLRAKVDAKEISGGDDLLEALGTSIRAAARARRLARPALRRRGRASPTSGCSSG